MLLDGDLQDKSGLSLDLDKVLAGFERSRGVHKVFNSLDLPSYQPMDYVAVAQAGVSGRAVRLDRDDKAPLGVLSFGLNSSAISG